MDRIKAVLFDLDGVLVETDKLHYKAWKWLCDQRGWKFDPEVNHMLRGVPRLRSLEIILKHNHILLSNEEIESLAEIKNTYYVKMIDCLTPNNLLPGVLSFLSKLKQRKIKMCLCSSSKNAITILDKLGIGQFFEAIVTGDDIQRAKPDPEIFQIGSQRLHVSPSQCVVFEDAISGIEAAKAAKMTCIGICRHDSLSGLCEMVMSFDEIDIDALLTEGRAKAAVIDPWQIIEADIEPSRLKFFESVFALSNGYMGIRGTIDADCPGFRDYSYPAFFINGVYDYASYKYEVPFINLAKRRHCILNICDWRIFNLNICGERFDPTQGRLLYYRRQLDMKQGVLNSDVLWESPCGRQVQIRSARIVSMVRRHIAAVNYEVTALNFSGTISIESCINGNVESQALPGNHLSLISHGVKDDMRFLHCQTHTDHIDVAMVFHHHSKASEKLETVLTTSNGSFKEVVKADCEQGQAISVTKTGSFYTSIESDKNTLLDRAFNELKGACDDGFQELLKEQKEYWSRYWSTADIEIEGVPRDQQAIRFNLFHLAQSLPDDHYRSISANGQTGDHYSGCVFWDTEMFIVPNFVYTNPKAVRMLLEWRYDRLEHARSYAKQICLSGANYPWATISGEDIICVPEGPSTEHHLNCAIARAIWQYWMATGDEDFVFGKCAEILFETARFFVSLGQFVPNRNNQFCINSVTGPDEYAVGVNNNCYTNVMVQWHLRFARQVHDRLRQNQPEQYNALVGKINLNPDECEEWQHAADNMYIPFNEQLGIHEQDDSFLYLAPVDMNLIPKYQDIQMSCPPANLRRLPVVKQADVVLLMFTRGEQFSIEQKHANYEYYEPRTSHGSSLSPGVYSIIASEIGKTQDAYRYFQQAVLLDLFDLRGNVAGGLHLACMGTAWMAVINGFGGMRDYQDRLIFNPELPREWTMCRFKVRYKGQMLEVEMRKAGTNFCLIEGNSLTFLCQHQSIELSREKPMRLVVANA